MIEAINSSIAASSILRPIVDQALNARGQSASIEPVQRSPQAPYVSPYIFVDNANNKTVLQIRDRESGDVVQEIPSDSQLRAYSQASQRQVSKQNTAGRADSSATAIQSAPSDSGNLDVQVVEPSTSPRVAAADTSSEASSSDSGVASAPSVLITA